eukprot:134802_1
MSSVVNFVVGGVSSIYEAISEQSQVANIPTPVGQNQLQLGLRALAELMDKSIDSKIEVARHEIRSEMEVLRNELLTKIHGAILLHDNDVYKCCWERFTKARSSFLKSQGHKAGVEAFKKAMDFEGSALQKNEIAFQFILVSCPQSERREFLKDAIDPVKGNVNAHIERVLPMLWGFSIACAKSLKEVEQEVLEISAEILLGDIDPSQSEKAVLDYIQTFDFICQEEKAMLTLYIHAGIGKRFAEAVGKSDTHVAVGVSGPQYDVLSAFGVRAGV